MKIKEALRGAFTPPEPRNKDRFISSIRYPKLSYSEFILSQIGYIRKRVWLFSGAVLLMVISAVYVIPQNERYLVWIVSALIPFLALMTAMEISRSDIFGMSEIEAGCRYSMPQLVGARMIILGVCNFAVISAIAVILGFFSPLGMMKAALYILTPYITVNGISLVVLDKVTGLECVYISTAATLGVSLTGIFLLGGILFDTHFVNTLYTVLCAGGVIVTAVQVRKIMNGRDDCYGISN
ncbi:MAG: hypothetical protein K2N41_00170 [Lachnospiraceae bacterium]|nr:hypothetical protein [Lachnospiraceae bacterium]MDE7238111.1 hypothetical protein [Lachnospiraceae bacterium]